MKVVLFVVFSCVYVEHHIIIFLYHTKLTVKTVVIYGVYYGSRASKYGASASCYFALHTLKTIPWIHEAGFDVSLTFTRTSILCMRAETYPGESQQ